MMNSLHLPTVNACLNGVSALFLTAGFILIKKNKVAPHKVAMGMAFFSSTLFLALYLYYHYQVGATRFSGTGLIRPLYFFILITHTVTATAVVPLALVTLHRAWRKHWESHKKWARITWPLWMYVSVTGVLIYWLLYHVAP